MVDKQQIRNALTQIEDDARDARNNAPLYSNEAASFRMIARLAQIIRESIVE